jgi:hypothetical protein
MHKVRVSREGSRWVFEIDGVGSGVATTVDGVVKTVAERTALPPGQSPVSIWEWTDSYVDEALSLGDERVDIMRRELELDVKTRAAVVSLSDRGLSVRDIGHFLGISAGRVSQLRAPGQVFGDPEDTTSAIQVVDLYTDKGVVTRFGRGALPQEIPYDGNVYRRTGTGHEVNGGPKKYSYVLKTSPEPALPASHGDEP